MKKTVANNVASQSENFQDGDADNKTQSPESIIPKTLLQLDEDSQPFLAALKDKTGSTTPSTTTTPRAILLKHNKSSKVGPLLLQNLNNNINADSSDSVSDVNLNSDKESMLSRVTWWPRMIIDDPNINNIVEVSEGQPPEIRQAEDQWLLVSLKDELPNDYYFSSAALAAGFS